jgi:DNA ligase (NAD+)
MDVKKLKEIVDKIDDCDDVYYNKHQKIISDQEYDGLKDTIQSCIKTFDPKKKSDEKLLIRMKDILSRVGAPPPKDGTWPKVSHLVPMGSLNKVNLPKELASWFAECGNKGPLFVCEKLDGSSLSLQYDNGKFALGASRGGGDVGEDISRNVRRMKNIPTTLPEDFSGYIRGECILCHSDMIHFPDITSARNGASGIASRIDGDGVEHASVLVYTVEGKDFNTEVEQFKFLKKMGFKTPNYYLCNTLQEVVDLWNKYMVSVRDTLDYDIDGLVVRINDRMVQLALGEKNHRPKGATAFKFEAPEARTVIRDIIWQVGDTGRITPVAIFDEVNLLNAKITNASLYNISNVEKLKIDIGAEVIVIRANDIIPACKSVVKSTGTFAKAPDKCPCCGANTARQGEYLVCTNKNCPAQKIGRLNKWIAELGIMEWGESILTKLIDAKLVSDIADLYKVKAEDIEKLDRMGEKSAKKLITEIDKYREVSLENFIGGLCIEGIGTSTVKLVIDAGYDDLNKIKAMTISQFANLAGFGVVRAEGFYYGMIENKQRMQDILDAGVKIKQKAQGNLNGLSFCFTGTMTTPRVKLQKLVEDNGGSFKKSVGKDLSYLVCEDPNGNSSKLKAAMKNGTKLISEAKFLEMI